VADHPRGPLDFGGQTRVQNLKKLEYFAREKDKFEASAGLFWVLGWDFLPRDLSISRSFTKS